MNNCQVNAIETFEKKTGLTLNDKLKGKFVNSTLKELLSNFWKMKTNKILIHPSYKNLPVWLTEEFGLDETVFYLEFKADKFFSLKNIKTDEELELWSDDFMDIVFKVEEKLKNSGYEWWTDVDHIGSSWYVMYKKNKEWFIIHVTENEKDFSDYDPVKYNRKSPFEKEEKIKLKALKDKWRQLKCRMN